MADSFVFYRYRVGDPPYRRTPTGRYEQYRPTRDGWSGCNQNARGLRRIAWNFLPTEAKKNAYAPALDASVEGDKS